MLRDIPYDTMRFINFTPIYQTRVWGGRALETTFGRTLPDAQPYGESWEVVDRAEANSLIKGGKYGGKTLRQALEADSTAIMGPGWNPATPFPILVKWLDAKERLSLQVHPPAEIAPEMGGEPKTENWYVAQAEEGAGLIVGLKHGTTKEAFAKHLAENTLEQAVHRMEVRPGDSMFVRSGRLHAIDGGNLILEIQQNSDTTYRVYDWGRVGLDGKPREMHVEQSLKCIDFNDFEPDLIRSEKSEQQLVTSEIFDLRKVELKDGESIYFAGKEQPRLLSLTSGSLREISDGDTLATSESVLLPYAEDFTFVAHGATTLLITENFSHNT